MLYVRELMTEYARDFVVVERTHESRRHSDRRVRGIAPRRECVRRILVDDVDARHWEPCTLRKLLNESIELRSTRTIHLACMIHAEHHTIGEPVREEVHAKRDDEHDSHTRMSGEDAAESNHERHEERHKHCRLKCVHRLLPPCRDKFFVLLTISYRDIMEKGWNPLKSFRN